MGEEKLLYDIVPNKEWALQMMFRIEASERKIEQLEKQLAETPVETTWVSTWKAAKKLRQSVKTLDKDIDRDLELKPENATYIEGYNVKTLPSGKRKVADFWLKGKVIPMENVGFLKAI